MKVKMVWYHVFLADFSTLLNVSLRTISCIHVPQRLQCIDNNVMHLHVGWVHMFFKLAPSIMNWMISNAIYCDEEVGREERKELIWITSKGYLRALDLSSTLIIHKLMPYMHVKKSEFSVTTDWNFGFYPHMLFCSLERTDVGWKLPWHWKNKSDWTRSWWRSNFKSTFTRGIRRYSHANCIRPSNCTLCTEVQAGYNSCFSRVIIFSPACLLFPDSEITIDIFPS